MNNAEEESEYELIVSSFFLMAHHSQEKPLKILDCNRIQRMRCLFL